MATTLVAQEIFSTSFQTEEEFNQWVVVDGNGDGSTWKFDSSSSPSYVLYSYNSSNSGDDWLISPSIVSDKTGMLAVSFTVKGSSYGEKLEVFYGAGQSLDAMTNRMTDIISLDDKETSHFYLINVNANEPINLGFHACSDPDKWRLYVCEVKVQFTENPVDIQAIEFISPVSGFGLNQENVTIRVKNSGGVDVNSFDLSFAIGETTIATETVNQYLAAGAEMEYTFTAKADLSEPRKLFALKAWTSHADDVNVNNDSCVTEVLHKAPASVPYSMGFEASEYTDGITLFNLNEDEGNWDIYTDPWWNLARTGDFCLAYNYDKNNNGDDWAILEPITIAEAGYYVLKFWYSGDDTHPEKLGVYYGNEANPEAMTNKIVEYAPFARSAYEESINIIYIDQPQDIYIGFHAFSDKDENWLCVDDVTFEKVDAEAIDLAVLPITNPVEYVHNGTKKDINFKVRNLGIKDAISTIRVKIGENVVYEENMTIAAQEIKEIAVEGALNGLDAGVNTITAEVVCAEDVDLANNTQSASFRVVVNPVLAWDFEDGQIPVDFIFRTEDEGTVNSGAGEEFNEYGWGIFNIGEQELFGENMFAGTTWLDGTEKADRWCILPPFKPTDESFLVWDVASYNPNFLESYEVKISTSGDDSFYYFTEEEFIAESAEFKTRGIDLSDYAGQSIYIAFRLRSKNCEHLILDNIELYGGSKVELLEVSATVDPVEGKVEKLDKFTITFDNVESVKLETYSYYPPYIATVAEDGTMTKLAEAKANIIEGQPTQLGIEIVQEGMTEITDKGKYALVIPRKDLIFNDDAKLLITAKEFVFNYEIQGEIDPEEAFTPISVSPAEGKVERLYEIVITFDESYFSKGLRISGSKVSLFDDAGKIVTNGTVAAVGTEAKVKITLNEEVSSVGNYILVIDAGKIKDYANPTFKNPEIRLNYNVIGIRNINMTITPKGGVRSDFSDMPTLEIIDDNTFTIIFEGASEDDEILINEAFLDKNNDSLIILWDVDYEFNAGSKSVAMYPVLKEGTNNEFKLVRFPDSGIEWPITSNGLDYYWLSIPNGAFKINGKDNNYQSYCYTVNAENPNAVVVTLTPEGSNDFETAPELKVIDDNTFTVNISGDNIESIGINDLLIDKESEVYITLSEIDANWTEGKNEVRLYPVLKEGTNYEFSLNRFEESGLNWPITSSELGFYCLNIPNDAFIINGFGTDEMSYIYKITTVGIEAVDMNAQDLNVYSINGMLIKRNASWNEVLDLEPGIYIVNGEKIYIRR